MHWVTSHCMICSFFHTEPGDLAGPKLHAVQERQDRRQHPTAEKKGMLEEIVEEITEPLNIFIVSLLSWVQREPETENIQPSSVLVQLDLS